MADERDSAIWALEVAERRYLRAHGWTLDGDYWRPPDDAQFKYKSGYSHGHAVNAQKQRTYNPMFGGVRSEQPR
jgi:hypothetical protein